MSNDIKAKKTAKNPDIIFPRGKKIVTTIRPQKDTIHSTSSLRSDVDYIAMMSGIEL